MSTRIELESCVRVEQVTLRKNGVVILTGPSSCGKGEVAAALCQVMSIPSHAHLSMGEILRSAVTKAKTDVAYAKLLESQYSLSAKSNIFDCVDTSENLTKKVLFHMPELEHYFKRSGMKDFTSQLDWMEYCTMNGLLVLDRWTQDFIAAHIESSEDLRSRPFILDGYPRTVKAAKHLLDFLERLQIPIIKVLHLSISKQEMIGRARQRARADDDDDSLVQRFQFYIESVQPSVDYLKVALGSDAIALIDAHQPVYEDVGATKVFNLNASISNVLADALRALGVPRIIVNDLLEKYDRIPGVKH